MQPTDLSLLRRWQGGDKDAGKELLERYYRSLHRFFHAKGVDGVNDLIQETLLACLEQADRFREEASLGAFIFGIARRRLYRRLSQRYREAGDPGLQSLEDLGVSPSQLRQQKEEQRLVLHALRRLSLDDQVLLELYYWEDLSAGELSVALEIPEGTVRSRLRLAKGRFEGEFHGVARERRHLESTMDNLEAWARAIARDPER